MKSFVPQDWCLKIPLKFCGMIHYIRILWETNIRPLFFQIFQLFNFPIYLLPPSYNIRDYILQICPRQYFISHLLIFVLASFFIPYPTRSLLYYFIPSTDNFYTILFSRIPSSVPSHVILIFPFFNKNNINLFYGVYYRMERVILIGMCKAKSPNHSDASPHQGIHKQQPSWILNLHIYNVVIDVESSCSCEKKTYGFIHVIKHQYASNQTKAS